MSISTKPHLKPLADLPARLRDKIRIDPVGMDEMSAHWIWMGAFTEPRRRYKTYPPREGNESYSDKVGSYVSERGSTKIHCRELGYATQGHRVVFAAARGLPVTEVPQLRRCTEGRCVSPYHHWPIGPIPERGLKKREKPGPGTPIGLAMLMALDEDAQPYEGCVDRLVALEGAVPSIDPSLVSDEAWSKFREWKAAQP